MNTACGCCKVVVVKTELGFPAGREGTWLSRWAIINQGESLARGYTSSCLRIRLSQATLSPARGCAEVVCSGGGLRWQGESGLLKTSRFGWCGAAPRQACGWRVLGLVLACARVAAPAGAGIAVLPRGPGLGGVEGRARVGMGLKTGSRGGKTPDSQVGAPCPMVRDIWGISPPLHAGARGQAVGPGTGAASRRRGQSPHPKRHPQGWERGCIPLSPFPCSPCLPRATHFHACELCKGSR